MAIPVLANQIPAPAATGQDVLGDIVLDITDPDGNLDASLTVLKIGELVIWTGDAPAGGWTGSKAPITDGFTYTLTPPVGGGRGSGTVTISVYAEDLAAESLTSSYSYKTAMVAGELYLPFHDAFDDNTLAPWEDLSESGGSAADTGGQLVLTTPSGALQRGITQLLTTAFANAIDEFAGKLLRFEVEYDSDGGVATVDAGQTMYFTVQETIAGSGRVQVRKAVWSDKFQILDNTRRGGTNYWFEKGQSGTAVDTAVNPTKVRTFLNTSNTTQQLPAADGGHWLKPGEACVRWQHPSTTWYTIDISLVGAGLWSATDRIFFAAANHWSTSPAITARWNYAEVQEITPQASGSAKPLTIVATDGTGTTHLSSDSGASFAGIDLTGYPGGFDHGFGLYSELHLLTNYSNLWEHYPGSENVWRDSGLAVAAGSHLPLRHSRHWPGALAMFDNSGVSLNVKWSDNGPDPGQFASIGSIPPVGGIQTGEDVLVVSPTEIYAGVLVTGGGHSEIAKWNGSVWSTVWTFGGAGARFARRADGTMLAVSAGGQAAYYNGSTWASKTFSLGTTGYNLTDVKVFNNLFYVSVVGTVDALYTFDGVSTWTLVRAFNTIANGTNTRIHITDANDYVIGGSVPAGNNFVLEHWNGSSWNIRSSVAAFASFESMDSMPAESFVLPSWLGVVPTPDETGVTPSGPYRIRILDSGSGVDVATVVLTIGGTTVWTGDAPANSWTGTRTAVPQGYEYELTPPSALPLLTLTTITGAADNLEGASFSDSFTFTTSDAVAPTIALVSPTAGDTRLDPTTPVVVDITDANDDVDVAGTVIRVNGLPVWAADTPAAGWTGSKSAITDGYRYTLQRYAGMPEGRVDITVDAVDLLALPTAFAFTIYTSSKALVAPRQPVKTWYRNEFDGSQAIPSFAPFGTVAQVGGKLQITLGAGESGDQFINDSFAVPYASVLFGHQRAEVIQIESALTDFTGSGTQRIAGMALINSRDPVHSYYQFFFREDLDRLDIERGIDGAGHANIFNVGVGTFNGQHRSRVVLDRVDNTLQFWHSLDDGATWTLRHERTPDFSIDQVLLYARQFGSDPSVDAQWDYLEVSVGSHLQKRASPAPGTVAGVEEVASFPETVKYPAKDTALTDSTGVSDTGTLDRMETAAVKAPAIFRPIAEVDENVTLGVNVDADYANFKQDGDGNDLLGGYAVSQVIAIDATADGFGDPTNNNHWGAAQDGKFYADGVECAAGDFGSGSLRRTAWRFSGDEPLDADSGAIGTVTLTSPDLIKLERVGSSGGGWWTVGTVTSHLCWRLQGDFDIQVDYSNYSFSSSDANVNLYVMSNLGGSPGNNFFRVARGSFNYFREKATNGSTTDAASVGFGASSGKLRITRVGSNFQAYYQEGGGWITIGGTLTHAVIGTGDVFVFLGSSVNNGSGSVELSNFTVNSGTVDNHAGWWNEASGTHRGTQQAMPDTLAAVMTDDSLDLVDLVTNKLWMRFAQGTDNLIFTSTGARARRATWDDGVLLLAHGESEAGGGSGGGMLIDFTTDSARLYRQSASIPGALYGGTFNRLDGLATRNSAIAWTGTDSAWEIPDHKCRDTDLYRDSGFEYHAIATIDGVAVGKMQRWYRANSPTVETSHSSEVSTILACLFDSANGELFYMDDTNLYSVSKATWEGVMPTTQIFSAATTKALGGIRVSDAMHHFVKVGTKIYVPAQEGVYVIDWPSGTFSLQYGTASSGAAFPILPSIGGVNAIAYALDGATNVLVCSLQGTTSVAIVNLDNDTLHAIGVPELGKMPTTIAVY